MVAANDDEVRRNAETCLQRLYEAVPGLARPVAQRAFESHLRDLLAVVTAYLKGQLEWPGALIGIEAAYLQARACVDDRDCVGALAEATARVARVAGQDLDALTDALEEADRRDRQSTPAEASGTGFALRVSNSKPKANPKVQTSDPKPNPYAKPKSEASSS